MNIRRPLHPAILVAIACLFAFQSAGAVITSGYIEDFTESTEDACTDLGDTNSFLAPAGPGIEGSLMDYVSVPLCDMPANMVMASAGPGIEGSIAEYVVPAASDMPVNTFQTTDVQDARICDADAADLKHAEPCYKAD